MKVQVFHLEVSSTEDETNFGRDLRTAMYFGMKNKLAAVWLEPSEKAAFLKVADVECVNMDHAYELTNNITRAWQENEGVTAVGTARESARSTSMGDVLVGPDNVPMVVASFGFEELL